MFATKIPISPTLNQNNTTHDRRKSNVHDMAKQVKLLNENNDY